MAKQSNKQRTRKKVEAKPAKEEVKSKTAEEMVEEVHNESTNKQEPEAKEPITKPLEDSSDLKMLSLESGKQFKGRFNGFNQEGNGILQSSNDEMTILPTKLIPRFQTIDVGSQVSIKATEDNEFQVEILHD